MEIIVVGINYQTAPIAYRECFALGGRKRIAAYGALKDMDFLEEAVILSTCNRTEIYAYVPDGKQGIRGLTDYLSRLADKPSEDYAALYYEKRGEEAVNQLYNVATGLDSMVLGEDQILGQVKAAQQEAQETGGSGVVLHTLFRYAVTAAKKVKHATALSDTPVSVSTIAIQFARRRLGTLRNKRVFVYGLGKMSIITIRNLLAEGVEAVYAVNRSGHRTEMVMASLPGMEIVPYEDRFAVMGTCDVVFSATSAPHYVVTAEHFFPHYKGGTVLFMDLSLPRDIEPALGTLPGVTLYCLDDLQAVSRENRDTIKREADRAKVLLIDETAAFWEWYRCRRAAPAIRELVKYYNRHLDSTLEEMDKRLGHLSDGDRKQIEAGLTIMARRMFKSPILKMKEAACQGNDTELVRMVQELFDLDGKE